MTFLVRRDRLLCHNQLLVRVSGQGMMVSMLSLKNIVVIDMEKTISSLPSMPKSWLHHKSTLESTAINVTAQGPYSIFVITT